MEELIEKNVTKPNNHSIKKSDTNIFWKTRVSNRYKEYDDIDIINDEMNVMNDEINRNVHFEKPSTIPTAKNSKKCIK